MKILKKIIKFIIYPTIIFIISLVNLKFNFIMMPNKKDFLDIQMAFITVSTVFAGFSFTALGLLFGLSSEELIKKLKNTNIALIRVKRLIKSIVYFIISVIVSLFFVLGVNDFILNKIAIKDKIELVIYVFGIGLMIVGICYFVRSVYDLYFLIKHVYLFNQDKNIEEDIKEASAQLEKNQEYRKHCDFDEEEQE